MGSCREELLKGADDEELFVTQRLRGVAVGEELMWEADGEEL